MADPRRFVLNRIEDETGVSGTGVVAWGVEFPDGVAVLRWNTPWPTSVVWHDRGMAAVDHVHGHNGKTEIMWLDTTETQRDDLAATLAKAREMVTEIEATADDSCGPDAFDEAVADLVAFLLTKSPAEAEAIRQATRTQP